MKTTTKLFTLMILVFGFALIGASCGGDDSAAPAEEPAAPAAEPAAPAEPAPAEEEAMEAMEETPVRLAVFVGAKENTYWTAQLDAATARAEELGATVQGFGAEFDPAKQVAQLEDAIASGEYDAFVISSVDGQAVVPALEEGHRGGNHRRLPVPLRPGPDPVGESDRRRRLDGRSSLGTRRPPRRRVGGGILRRHGPLQRHIPTGPLRALR